MSLLLLVLGLIGVAAGGADSLVPRIRIPHGPAAPMVAVENGASGHRQIGVRENGLVAETGGQVLLRFATLGRWAYDTTHPPPCPEEVASLGRRRVTCIGFMYPLEAGADLRLFCLLRTTQTCCYGPRPQFNQYLFVEVAQPVRFERFAPVQVSGRFFVDPRPDQGYIYRMEAESVEPVAEAVEVDAARVALEAGLPCLSLSSLPASQELDGKRVVVEGFIVDRQEGATSSLVLARDWWDGRGQGVPPTGRSAMRVTLKAGEPMPPVWMDRGVLVGTLVLEPDPSRWHAHGMVRLDDATRVVADSPPQGVAWILARPLRWVILLLVPVAVMLLRRRGR